MRLVTEKGEELHHYKNPENIQYNLIRSIVETLQGKTGACPSTGITAARTNRVLEEIVKPYYKDDEEMMR